MERIQERTHVRKNGIVLFITLALVALALSACGGADKAGIAGDGLPRPDYSNVPPSQVANGSDELKVAVRYVSYVDGKGGAIASEQDVRSALDQINKTWAQCRVSLVLEKYETIAPASIGQSFNPGSYSEIDAARETLQPPPSVPNLLIIGTGLWGRGNDLGSANCYSSFPGDSADGIICEGNAASNGFLLSHEVGHWFYLQHTNHSGLDDEVDDTVWGETDNNVMQNIVGPDQSVLTAGQCLRARTSIVESRKAALVR